MKRNTLIHASLAAFFPFIALQACVVEEEEIGAADDEIVLEDDCIIGEVLTCTPDLDPGLPGEQTCIEDADGYVGWTACEARQMNGPEDCEEFEIWDGEQCVVSGVGSTPIVLRFGASPVRYAAGGGDFDLTGRGYNVSTDWPTATTPWLALDRDGDGRIGDGGELFGSATRLSSGGLAEHGFEALAELDDNGDGAITAADPAFDQLRLWADANADRASQPGELITLAEAGITSLSLSFEVNVRCDARGNCGRERAAFSYTDASGTRHQGEAVDVHLRWR